MLRTACLSLTVVLFATVAVAADNPTPVGVWLHPNGRIQMKVSECGEELCARLVWFKSPNDAEGKPLADVNNPDPALRARKLLGLQVLHSLRPTGEGAWDDGEAYNPDDGENYSVQMSIQEDGTLLVRGYVLVSLLGKSVVWTRVK